MSIRKLFVGLVAVAMLVGVTVSAQTMTEAQIRAEIERLMGLVAALSGGTTGGTSAPCTFTRDLTVGSTGADVSCLQGYLVSQGHLMMPAGVAMGYFGDLTRAATARWQTANGVAPAVGYFGPLSQAKYRMVAGGTGTGSTGSVICPVGFTCTQTGGTTGGSTGLTGGAGSVESYDLVSGLTGEEVGEDEDDKEVAGLEIEADDNSDLELTAVRLVFDEGAAATASDFDNYASEVSIWLDGEELARVDADEFNDDNAWSKTVSLDDGGIIRAGKTGELIVAVSGVSNLDSGDTSDTWTVDFRQVRFRDADGDSISEDPLTGTRTFSFESFATAADTVFKVTEPNNPVNDAHTIGVDASEATDDEPILVYNVEIEGDSAVTVDKLPVGVLVANATNVDGMVSGFKLLMDGDEVGSANISDCMEDSDCSSVGTYETFIFDDLDLLLEGGDEYEFTVTADFYPTSGSGDLDEGDTITASTSADLLEDSNGTTNFADIEDESGEDLAAADIEGSASSDANTVYANGIQVALVSTSVEEKTVDSTDNDYVNLFLTFDVTAYGQDAYIPKTISYMSSSTSATPGAQSIPSTSQGMGFHIQGTPSATLLGMASSSVVSVITTDADEGTNTFTVREGSSNKERFTLKVTVSNTAASGEPLDGLQVRAIMTGINFAASDTATGAGVYSSDLESTFRTAYGRIAD